MRGWPRALLARLAALPRTTQVHSSCALRDRAPRLRGFRSAASSVTRNRQLPVACSRAARAAAPARVPAASEFADAARSGGRQAQRAPAHRATFEIGEVVTVLESHAQRAVGELELANLDRRPDLLHREVAAFLLVMRADDAIGRGIAHVVDAAVRDRCVRCPRRRRPRRIRPPPWGCGPSRPSSRAIPRRCRRRRARAGIPSA